MSEEDFDAIWTVGEPVEVIVSPSVLLSTSESRSVGGVSETRFVNWFGWDWFNWR